MEFIKLFITITTLFYHFATSSTDHLIVLSHGLMGSSTDLIVLENLLHKRGYRSTLRSSGNEYHKSLLGIVRGGKTLASEILEWKRSHPSLRRISFVGNSLGGLFARYSLFELYDESNGTIAGLVPESFMTIATPHLGVKDFSYFDAYGIPLPNLVKQIASKLFLKSGEDLFLNDHTKPEDTLLYEMATDERFIIPLKSFKRFRIYCNLNQDFVVPIGSSSLLDEKMIDELRRKYKNTFGIVEEINGTVRNTSSKTSSNYIETMRNGLNECGWDRVIVHFKTLIPMAHNKIASLTKYPSWFYNDILGFNEGQYVMEHASDWLTNAKQ